MRPLPHHASAPLLHMQRYQGQGHPLHLEGNGISADEGRVPDNDVPVLPEKDEHMHVGVLGTCGPPSHLHLPIQLYHKGGLHQLWQPPGLSDRGDLWLDLPQRLGG